MHIPKVFKQNNLEELTSLIENNPFATLITTGASGLDTNHLPMTLIRKDGELYLNAHIAKVNPLWNEVDNGSEVLITFNGPHCYISPNSYPTKKLTEKAVPTWNYVVVQAKGKITFIHESQWIQKAIEDLTSQHESNQEIPWTLSDAPTEYIKKMLNAVVGIEIKVESLKGMWKLSQNQPINNQKGIIESLSRNDGQLDRKIASLITENLELTNKA